MKSGMSLIELAKAATKNAESNSDIIAPTNAMTTFVENEDLKINIAGEKAAMSDHAAKQVAAYLEIPTRYAEKMIKQQPDLATQTFNTWMTAKPVPDKRMIRFDGKGDVRAFLSNSYKRIDNDAVLETALQALDGSAYQVESSNIYDSGAMALSVIFPKLEREIALNDVVQFGLTIRNNEIGSGALLVQPFSKRLVCLNGMICAFGMKDFQFRTTHLGARQNEIASQTTLNLELKAIMSRISDTIQAITHPDGIARQAEMMKKACSDSVSVDSPIDAINRLEKAFHLPKSENESILERFIRGDSGLQNPSNQWTMANAVTNLANDDSVSYARSIELQEIGGKILELNPSQWEKIAVAA